MSDSCRHNNPLRHEGSSQADRHLWALDPENVELYGLDASDWLHFAYEYARLINYYPDDNANASNGDWQAFFEAEVEALLERYGEGDVEPHMALFISFLKLLAYPRQSLNELPKRHLDFYYKEVLKLKKQSYKPDRVHMLFELAKNAGHELVEENVLLKAGKDSEGNPLNYTILDPLVVNPGRVAALKSVYVDRDGILRQAPVSDSADGEGEELDEDQSWTAFGQVAEEDGSIWPEADLSFYIVSHLLNLEEGRRTVALTLTLTGSSMPEGFLSDKIQARFTGAEGWLDPLKAEFVDENNMKWRFVLDTEKDPVTGYQEAIHQASLSTNQPVMHIGFTDHTHYENLKKARIEDITLEVTAEEIESLQLQNELGNLDPTKPFRPFGSSPKVGSKLSIIYPEMYGKPISSFDLSMQWLNLPANFSDHYEQYQTAIVKQKDHYVAYYDLIVNYNVTGFYLGAALETNGDEDASDDDMRDNFKVEVSSPFESESDSFELFTDPPQVEVMVGADSDETRAVNKGAIELALTESFYHDLYPELYVNAILKAEDEEEADLPNEPYTPLLDQLRLHYTARQEVSFAEDGNEEASTLMFHGHPFGTKRVGTEENTLLPDYNHGTLYIGLDELEPSNNISLLFQVAEGSENPLHSAFPEGETKIEWAALSNNNWIDLEGELIRNETNHFLRSGIVEIALPQRTTNSNTLLESGLHWLRIQLKKEPDAVCRFVGVHAQAATAEFFNQGNTTDHLDEALPAETIGKLVNSRAKLKSVVQPYDSFGGQPRETDNAFYRRVSERLRHKNRAISIWDYEHLVLQHFPSLQKVKCLNHTFWNGSVLDELKPGNVTLVLIPKLTDEDTAYRLKPKVSQDFKDRVETFLSKRSSPHADVRATNAVYEPVLFEFNIRFNEGLDFHFYEKQTKDDLKRLVAPWVFESNEAIRFGGTFTEYEIVHYLENLQYVAYVENFNMFHQPAGSEEFSKKSEVRPSNPMAILVPAENHTINLATACT